MQSIPWLTLLVRYLHLLAMAITVGGAFYMRFIQLKPAQQNLDAATQLQLRQAMMQRWRLVLHIAVTVLLITGFYNLMVALAGKPGHLYHLIFGIKFIAAMGLFMLVILLASRHERPKFEQHRSRYMLVAVILGLVIVLLSLMLKYLPRFAA